MIFGSSHFQNQSQSWIGMAQASNLGRQAAAQSLVAVQDIMWGGWGSKKSEAVSRSPCNKDHSMLGSILGPSVFENSHVCGWLWKSGSSVFVRLRGATVPCGQRTKLTKRREPQIQSSAIWLTILYDMAVSKNQRPQYRPQINTKALIIRTPTERAPPNFWKQPYQWQPTLHSPGHTRAPK